MAKEYIAQVSLISLHYVLLVLLDNSCLWNNLRFMQQRMITTLWCGKEMGFFTMFTV
jgi:hypothetical protein